MSPRHLLRHLDRLAAAGVSARQVAQRAGVAEATLSQARRPGVKVSRIVAAAVLAVEP